MKKLKKMINKWNLEIKTSEYIIHIYQMNKKM
jgi:hypothetical protein